MAQVTLSGETLSQLKHLIHEMNIELKRDEKNIMMDGAAPVKRKPANFYLMLREGNVEGVRSILNDGQDPSVTTSDGATPLMAAAVHDQPEIAELLLALGAEADAQDNRGYSALMIAASRGHVEVARALIDFGADVFLYDKDGFTALMWAKKNGHQEIVGLLKKRMDEGDSLRK